MSDDDLIQMVRDFLEANPGCAPRLRRFLETNDGDRLWNTQDVMEFTGWKATHISRLCVNGTLPHIPGKPHKFVPQVIKATLEQMQIGGMYGRRKSKTRRR